jgi:tetratricopeptide (TPR) repeat protein
MGEYEKARNYFQLLLETTPQDDHLDIATIHSYFGRLAREDALFDKALFHHHKALQVRSFIHSD